MINYNEVSYIYDSLIESVNFHETNIDLYRLQKEFEMMRKPRKKIGIGQYSKGY